MNEHKEVMPKVRRSITISKELVDWINGQIEERRFKDFSHGVEFSVYKLKKETEKQESWKGTPQPMISKWLGDIISNIHVNNAYNTPRVI